MFCLNSYFTATTPLFSSSGSSFDPWQKTPLSQQWIFDQIPILSDLPDTPNWIRSCFAFLFMAMVNFLSSFYVLLSLFSLSVKILILQAFCCSRHFGSIWKIVFQVNPVKSSVDHQNCWSPFSRRKSETNTENSTFSKMVRYSFSKSVIFTVLIFDANW